MIYIFILLTFFLSWGIVFSLPADYVDLAMFVPGSIAVLLTIFSKYQFSALLKLGTLRNALQGLLVSCLIFALFMVIATVFSLATFGLPASAIEYYNGSHAHAWFRLLIFGIPYSLVINIFFAIGEEIGWRGYLLKKIGDKVSSFWVRSLIVGLIWGIWHMPIYIVTGYPVAKMLIFIFNVCLISVVYTWLFERKYSIWPTTIAHGVHNMLFNSLLPIITLTQSQNSLLFGEEGLLVTISYTITIIIACWVIYYSKLADTTIQAT